MNLILVGMNHRTAPVEVREKVSFSEDEILEVLSRVRSDETLSEALLISTCNRTEFYGLSNDNGAAELYIRRLIDKRKNVDLEAHPGYAYTLMSIESVRHLLRVAAGLDSMVLGESQILGQVKRAHDLSLQSHACGHLLHRVLQTAVTVGKRVRNETEIGAGAVSVSSAAAELASKIFADLSSRSVLLIGVGDMGTLTARHMIERRVKHLTIANRTFKKAEELARELSGRAVPLDRVEACMLEADIVISCTGSPRPIFERSRMKDINRHRAGRPLYVIDIAVPRDFDPAIGELEGVFLHDIDDMNLLVDRNLETRRAQIPKAESIVEQELEEFLSWRQSLSATPVIKQLREKMEGLRAQEVDRHRKRFCTEDREQLDRLTESLVSKILHPMMRQVREWSEAGELGAMRIDSLYEALDLGRPRLEPEEGPSGPSSASESDDPSSRERR